MILNELKLQFSDDAISSATSFSTLIPKPGDLAVRNWAWLRMREGREFGRRELLWLGCKLVQVEVLYTKVGAVFCVVLLATSVANTQTKNHVSTPIPETKTQPPVKEDCVPHLNIEGDVLFDLAESGVDRSPSQGWITRSGV